MAVRGWLTGGRLTTALGKRGLVLGTTGGSSSAGSDSGEAERDREGSTGAAGVLSRSFSFGAGSSSSPCKPSSAAARRALRFSSASEMVIGRGTTSAVSAEYQEWTA
jgi:hypothetical protein